MTWMEALWGVVVQFWPLILGLGVPWAAGAIAGCNWSHRAKMLAAVAVSLLVGILGAFVSGLVLTPETLLAFIGGTFIVAQVAYAEFLRHKLTAKWLDRVLSWRPFDG